MRQPPRIRRVIVVVLDGVRPDAIAHFGMDHLRRLAMTGSASLQARTVAPSVTTAAMTSLLTGVSPARHGITSDRLFIPRVSSDIVPLPEALGAAGYPSAAYMASVPSVFKGIAARIGRRLGFGTLHTGGTCAPDILMAARHTIRTQRRGLILMHWPDADDAGHAEGWMSDAYGTACRRLDATLGLLAALADVSDDPYTALIALADHGGGGIAARDHESDHPLDTTIPLVINGGAVASGELLDARLLDVPATVLRILGVDVPPSYEGRVLHEAFGSEPSAAAAVA
ncbi:MAG TPA: alkaline phosphatase family protein [Gemmatimonadaceae bacterium]|nr:alkaline phosphatase family protein [Gemmatimonadaceae bacterium]